MKIIVSINPEYVEKILSGEKKFEYRTRAAKQQVDTLIIYATKPMMKVFTTFPFVIGNTNGNT